MRSQAVRRKAEPKRCIGLFLARGAATVLALVCTAGVASSMLPTLRADLVLGVTAIDLIVAFAALVWKASWDFIDDVYRPSK
ncbi:MAG TPA: hypothetical protein VFQ88_07745 [Nevskiaceae bacterium]|nr:hypothetical protein [Nevskiaceae bacterium]